MAIDTDDFLVLNPLYAEVINQSSTLYILKCLEKINMCLYFTYFINFDTMHARENHRQWHIYISQTVYAMFWWWYGDCVDQSISRYTVSYKVCHKYSEPSKERVNHQHVGLGYSGLTLNVRGPSYLGLTRSISWVLMPWLLASPGHQQPWYWLCRMGRSLSYLRKDFNHLYHINVEKWHKM